MALFERKAEPEDDEVVGSDAATRALSVTAVENDFVERRLREARLGLRPHFGPTLHPGRLQAIQRMGIQPGDRVLEVGVGTGINLSLYPPRLRGHRHRLLGLDAREGARARRRARASRNVRLLADGRRRSQFADDSFDIVYAPYLISVVPDPVAGRPRDAPRLPPRRPDHLPEPLPQPEPAARLGSSG